MIQAQILHVNKTRTDNNNSKHPALVSQEIEDLTTNTKQRLKAYHSFNKALDGTMWSMPEGNTCE